MRAAVGVPIVDPGAFARMQPMSASTPLQLPLEDKLDVLRYLDEFHYWHSLDDERFCKRCGRTITGRQVTIIELQGTRGKLRLQCPTAGCVSTVGDWVYANPVRAAKLRADSRTSEDKATTKTVPNERTHNGAHRGAGGMRLESVATKSKRIPLRLVVTRLSLSGPLGSGLHTIRPIA